MFWILTIFSIGLAIFFIIKVLIIKQEIKNIRKSLTDIINTDTNNLITISTNDKKLKELRNLEHEYKNGNKELKTSIMNISHDLIMPLTAIRGYLDLMDNDNLSEKQIVYLDIIDSKVKDLTFLTEQLFDFSKTLDIKDEIKQENLIINDILGDTVASFYSLFVSHNITPNIDICKDKVIRVLNENMLKRIFENIISNAIKYSKQDFNIKLYSNGIIEFSNQADGLNQVSLEKLFDRYYTVKSAKKSNGIGLSIAKQLVDLSGGTIEAKYKNNILIIMLLKR